MAINYTPLLSLAEPVTGTQSGTWGDDVNQGLTDYLDIAVAGAQVISGSQTAVTLSNTTGSAAGSNIAQVGSAGTTGTAQYAVINCTGNPASMLTITAPATSKTYVVINSTSTNQPVKLVGAAGPATGVTVAAAQAALIAWKGSDFALIATTDASKLTGTLGVANGGTGQTTYTDGQLLIGNSTGSTLTKATLSTSGTGFSVTNGAGTITLQNTAPDQVVALTGAGATTISGTYPNFTISSVNTTYGTATSTVPGLIELGSDTPQTTAANTVTATASRSYALQLNGSGQGIVNVPWTDTVYTLPAATSTVRGGIELGSDTVQSVAANTVTATASRTYGLQVNADGQGVVNVPWTDTVYTLPAATDTVRGGIELGSGTVQSVAANSVTATASRTYALQVNADGQGVVNVPWTDTAASPGGSTTQVQYNNAGSFGGSSGFVFDGTNVGIGEATPSTYGKFVVGGTGSFTSSLVSTSSTLSDKPTFEFRKTSNVTSGQLNTLGNIAFIGKFNSTPGEQAFITATSQNVGGLADSNIMTLGVRTIGGLGAMGANIEISNTAIYLESTNGADLSIVNGVLSYNGSNHLFTGDANFADALTVASVPVVTTTGSQTLTNKTLASNTVATTQTAGDNSTKVATTAFVQTAIGSTGATGTRGQAFTSNGTFTIPTGVTAVKITVVGGGGGGGSGGNAGCGGFYSGSGGGGAGTAQSFLTALTPGNTLSVTVGAAGAASASGGNSTVASGTQTISTITGGGGSAGALGNTGGAGGTATGGTINSGGGAGGSSSYLVGYYPTGGTGGSSSYGGGGAGGFGGAGSAGRLYGGGGGGGFGNSNIGGAGAAGVVIFEW